MYRTHLLVIVHHLCFLNPILHLSTMLRYNTLDSQTPMLQIPVVTTKNINPLDGFPHDVTTCLNLRES